MDLAEWLASEPVRAFLVPAVVAAIVTLAFEVVFKPSIAVRTERRLAEDRITREAVSAMHALASRARVVSLVKGQEIRLLRDEVTAMLDEVREVRDITVRGPEWGREVGEVLTASLALLQASGIKLDQASGQVIKTADIASLVTPGRDDLQLAARGLVAVAGWLNADPWQLVRRAKATRALKEAHGELEELKEARIGKVTVGLTDPPPA